ncbi:putative S-adenosylmethionine-dependent methyltransferase [Metallosphaera sp. J1]|uniref:class I SAM-dependent methyltransferase n=1 Tax=Metallosphaera TaxID=41980 RepID=UPI001EE1163B|nr:methyltransferase [Metallosphaera javensis (ex Hofmann et al. 2022)]MCG3107811.1 putative S-adenosylmethionine-dependent methyltransferase [Metallosphaera javensis (ex Hofmann et al. 2022)]BCS92038.1 MAG: putative S-adenosylmethionine-dependent methyltransferase [Metallosphaera javensis (ex Sakai et al. 2022)]
MEEMMFIVTDVVNGVPLNLVSYPGLFSKKRLDLGTRVLLENLLIPEEGAVADVGCGYGPIGIYVALVNPRLSVYMLDMNPLAVKASRENVERYGLGDRVTVIKSDLLSELGVRVKAIYSNPPLSKGVDVLERLAKQAPEKLEKGGYVQMVLYKGEGNATKIFGDYFPEVRVMKSVKGYSIVLAVNN